MKPEILINKVDERIKCQPDPYIFKTNGKYYIYATNSEGITVWGSDSFSDFKYIGKAFEKEDEKEFWAPCLIEDKGMYYMYYSAMPKNSNDVHDQQISVAVSDCPFKGFKVVAKLLPPFSIDPHVVKTDSGEWYIFYSENDYEAERAGTLIVADKLITPFKTEGKPAVVVRPTLDEEIFMPDRFKKGQHWHTLEGAFYFKEGDYHYLTYSGNCYEKPEYYIGYAVSSGSEADLRKLKFEKYPDSHTYKPLLKKNAYEEGTGHNSILREDDGYYIVYHARSLDAHKASEGDVRTARKRKLNVQDGTMNIEL